MTARPGAGDDRDDEILHHIHERADLLVAQGWTRRDALREAERRFGDVARIRRGMNARAGGPGGDLFRALGSDLRYALRGVGANPVFAATLVATLALGIGAASSIFAVVDALLLRPLPYRDASRLVEVNHAAWQAGGYSPGNTPSRAAAWRETGSEFADAWVAWSLERVAHTDGGRAEDLEVLAVTAGADTLLGIPLLFGRGFTREDVRAGSPGVVVLGRGFYERLGGDPGILGGTLRLESGPVTVVGVLRGGMRFPTWGGDPDIWLPIRDDFTVIDQPLQYVGLWARLRDGVSMPAAQARADLLASALQEREPLRDGWDVHLMPVGAQRVATDVRWALLTLSVGTAIFMIAWVNGLNLLLVRTITRGRELAVRLAIGGSRLRILRQLLVEGIVWGTLGGVAAVCLSFLATSVIRGAIPWVVEWSSPHALQVERRTLAVTFVASFLVGTVLGLVPGLHVLREGGISALTRRQSDDAPDRRKLRNGLVLAQVALSMTLLAVAGLFVKSFARLLSVDPGYEYERIAIADIGLSATRYPDPAARAEFFRRLEESLESHPAVEGVTLTNQRGFRSGEGLRPEGGHALPSRSAGIATASVAPDYVSVMGLDLLAGRPFEPADVGTGAVIIDQDLARLLWSENGVGRRFRFDDESDWKRVVGVVRELRLLGRDQREMPYLVLQPNAPNRAGTWVDVIVRTAGDPAAVLPVIREAVHALDPEQTIWRLRPAADAMAEQDEETRFLVTLLSLLAGIGVALAAIGLYGVMTFSVARRERELAVRLALGAEPRRVHRMVLREALTVAIPGIALGVAGALATSRAVERLLYEVRPHDAATFLATALLFLSIAAAASFVPALRATRVNPSETLRRD